MHARRVVIIPECLQLARQIERIPEQHLVEILAPDRADQRDPDAAKHGEIRVIDESGEDYLYPENFFAPIELPQPIRGAS